MQRFLVYHQPVRVSVQINYWRPRAPLLEVPMIAMASHKIGQLRNEAWRQCRQVVAMRKVKRDNPHLLPEQEQYLVTEAVDKAAAEYSDHWWTSRASEFMCYLTHTSDALGTPIKDQLDWDHPLSIYSSAVSNKPGEERHIVFYLADMTSILLDPSEVPEVYLDSGLAEEVSSAPVLLEPPRIVEPHPEEILSTPLLPLEITAQLPEKVVASDNIITEREEILSTPLLERPENAIVERLEEISPLLEQPQVVAEPPEAAEKEIAEPPKQRKKAGAPPEHLMSTLPRKPQPKRAAKKREPVRASPYPSRQKAIANKKRK